MPLSQELISFLDELFTATPCISGAHNWAVAVSGGGDSMALAHMLFAWRTLRGHDKLAIHVLSVDHALRDGSADDSLFVKDHFSSYEGALPQIFKVEWDEGKPSSGIMKIARDKRYDLMREYCARHHIAHLFLAHHQDDQMETFIMRLTKGSGLDGLTGMRSIQDFDGAGLMLVRPLLEHTHDELLDYCRDHNVEWREDPTNDNLSYTRNRLRSSRKIWEDEGLTSDKLARTTKRLARAKDALDFFTLKALDESLREQDDVHMSFNFDLLSTYPQDIILRVVLHAYDHLCPEKYYRPRLERLEHLMDELLFAPLDFKGRSLGRVNIHLKKSILTMQKEYLT